MSPTHRVLSTILCLVLHSRSTAHDPDTGQVDVNQRLVRAIPFYTSGSRSVEPQNTESCHSLQRFLTTSNPPDPSTRFCLPEPATNALSQLPPVTIMPVRLKQWHYAQAPQAFFDALITSRHHHAHVKALSVYYNNLISEDFPPRTLLNQLHDQIIASHKIFTAAQKDLSAVSEETGYLEDPERMTWIPRPGRRTYQYECTENEKQADQKEDQERGRKRPRNEQPMLKQEHITVRSLSEHIADICIGCSCRANGSDSDCNSPSDSDNSSRSSTPPSSPTVQTVVPIASKVKRVRFAPMSPKPDRRQGVSRIRTKEQVEEEFQAAAVVAAQVINEYENERKRRNTDDQWWSGAPLKRRKMWHDRPWPAAYRETV